MTEKVYEKLVSRQASLSLVGLGYVGMPIAVAFANKGLNVIGFDLNKEKIGLYKSGIDPTKEVGNEAIAACVPQKTLQTNLAAFGRGRELLA